MRRTDAYRARSACRMRPGIDQYAWSMAMLHMHAIMLMHRGMGHRELCAGSTIAQSRFTADNFAKRRLGPRLGALSVVGRKAGSTLRSSRAVPHPSTNRALRRLTSEVGRDPVHSTRYGRQRWSGEAIKSCKHTSAAQQRTRLALFPHNAD